MTDSDQAFGVSWRFISGYLHFTDSPIKPNCTWKVLCDERELALWCPKHEFIVILLIRNCHTCNSIVLFRDGPPTFLKLDYMAVSCEYFSRFLFHERELALWRPKHEFTVFCSQEIAMHVNQLHGHFLWAKWCKQSHFKAMSRLGNQRSPACHCENLATRVENRPGRVEFCIGYI